MTLDASPAELVVVAVTVVVVRALQAWADSRTGGMDVVPGGGLPQNQEQWQDEDRGRVGFR